MSHRPVFTAAAVLLVLQVAVVVERAAAAPGYVVPEVVMMRVKRSPDPMRSFSFSGFDPNGQMAAFTGMADYSTLMANYGPPAPQAAQNYGPPIVDSYGPPPSGSVEQADQNKVQQHGQPQGFYGPRPGVGAGASPVDSNEQNNSVEQVADNKKQHKGRGNGPSSNAEASFNAWFPIMFGVFPNGANGQSGSNNGGRGNQGQGQDQGSGSSYGGNGGYERSSSGPTVIANSVSNGRNSVSSSHAIAYHGNPRLSQK